MRTSPPPNMQKGGQPRCSRADSAKPASAQIQNRPPRRSILSRLTNHLHLVLVTAASVAAASSLQAQYINGQPVRIDLVNPFGVTLIDTVVVDSTPGAVEATNPNKSVSFDLSDIDSMRARILIHGLKYSDFGSSLNAVRFTFPDLPTPAFKNVRLDPSSNWSRLTEAALTFGPDYIQLDFAGCVNRNYFWAEISFENPALDQPRLSVTVSHVQLCWTISPNRKYQVQYRTDSAGGQWTNLGDAITATGPKTCITEPVTATPRFYRIVALP